MKIYGGGLDQKLLSKNIASSNAEFLKVVDDDQVKRHQNGMRRDIYIYRCEKSVHNPVALGD